jgi:hypothetical protein
MKENDHLGDIGMEGRIILKSILKRQGVKIWTGVMWLRKGTSGSLVNTIMILRKLLKKKPAPWSFLLAAR